jgi:hypothetical protein
MDLTLSEWASDRPLGIFSADTGMALKRQLVSGDFRDRAAVLPVLAAVGGMIMPVKLFTVTSLDIEQHAGSGHPHRYEHRLRIGSSRDDWPPPSRGLRGGPRLSWVVARTAHVE